MIAHVGYHARKLSRLVEAARKGSPLELINEEEPVHEDVAFASTLPAHALRYLFEHSAVHLNVEWRDLHDAGWNADVTNQEGDLGRIRETPLLRAREIWRMALALDNGGREDDVPDGLVARTERAARSPGSSYLPNSNKAISDFDLRLSPGYVPSNPAHAQHKPGLRWERAPARA